MDNLPKPASTEQTARILYQMKKCICKIYLKNEYGTGFFCVIPYNNKLYPVLVTNYHIINDKYIKDNNSIKISLNDEEETKSLSLSSDRVVLLKKELDTTIIEILDEDYINDYIELDDYLFDEKQISYYRGKTIYNLQYKDKAYVSHGKITSINNNEILYLCMTDSRVSGAPIINLDNNKVIGIHKLSSEKFNKGTFLKAPLTNYIEKKIEKATKSQATNFNNIKSDSINTIARNDNQTIKKSNNNTNQTKIISSSTTTTYINKNDNNNTSNYNNSNYTAAASNENTNQYNNEYDNENNGNNNYENSEKTNEIVITVNVPRKDVNNKNIYFLDNVGIFKDGEYHYHEHLKELDETNTELFINDTPYKYKKYFLAPKEGIYTVVLKLKTLLVDCSYMFGNCKFVTHIDLSNLDTSNVVNMKRMFYDCENLTSINFSSFNTRFVTNMECMFGNCKSLTTINLSSFNTSNVTTMKNLFHTCKNLESIHLSNFNTEKVTNMQCMFYGCNNLININLASFDTQNVTNMSSMFDACYKLENINVTSFNTQNVVNMEKMFNCCYNINYLDLSSFDFSKVTNRNAFLYGCDKLKEIKANQNNSSTIKEEVNPNNVPKIYC